MLYCCKVLAQNMPKGIQGRKKRGIQNMFDRITVQNKDGKLYDIVLESSFSHLGEEVSQLQVEKRKLCIVTDSNVAPLYLEAVEAQLQPYCKKVDSFVFPAGEGQKNLDTVRELYRYLIQHQYDRNDVLVALGGGVVGDLCGYGAATYLRGIRFIQVPTTLLSQVDSSIGGKTGVDFDAYKNMVGAFHMPSLVYTNTASLLTLTEEQYLSGMGEIIKHGLIKNRSYYDWIQEHTEQILLRDKDICGAMILESDKIKRDVVEQDPTEKGERALLNFGHTLGHAIEKLMNFELLHGQCVALGRVGAVYLSARRGEISMEMVQRVCEDFIRFGLPVSLQNMELRPEDILAATKKDKKMDSGAVKFILLHQIGDAFIDSTVSDQEILDTLCWMLRRTE